MDPSRKTYGRATEPKCKLMLPKSPQKMQLIAPVFFFLSYHVNNESVTYIQNICMELRNAISPLRLLAAG